jgi:hypothetical protein
MTFIPSDVTSQAFMQAFTNFITLFVLSIFYGIGLFLFITLTSLNLSKHFKSHILLCYHNYLGTIRNSLV